MIEPVLRQNETKSKLNKKINSKQTNHPILQHPTNIHSSNPVKIHPKNNSDQG